MLDIFDLTVEVAGNAVLRDVNLRVQEDELVALFGPNGSGKTSLVLSIMGLRRYRIRRGRIVFRGQDITDLPVNARARLGIGVLFQRPPTLRDVRLREIVRLSGAGDETLADWARALEITHLLERPVNDGYSGGEIKRTELLQLGLQQPDLLLLDEPESGVDLENVALVSVALNRLLGREGGPPAGSKTRKEQKGHRRAGLLITHTGYILESVAADRGIVLVDGRVVCEGNPQEMIRAIRQSGYQECVKCASRQT